MKKFTSIFIIYLFFIVDVYGGFLKDVIHLPSEAEQSEDAPIKKSSLSTKSNLPMAWIAGDINKEATRQISICLWIKSLDQGGTGTIISYTSVDEQIEFGLVGIDKKLNGKYTETPSSKVHNVYVVIKGRRARNPIKLRLDDVRWHHVCITWGSRLGLWRFYLDGVKIQQGMGLKRGQHISPGGRYYLGGGVGEWTDEERTVNGSIDSRTVVRVSTGFQTERKKRALYSQQTQRFHGKITDVYIWGKVLSPSQVRDMLNCSDAFREKFNEHVTTRTKVSETFRRPIRRRVRRKEWMGWASTKVIYSWDVNSISLQRPAALTHSGSLCGYPISVECETGSILISMETDVTNWYRVEHDQVHLNDFKCTPVKRGEYLVFHLADLSSCGTTREVVDRHLVFTNTISNSPASKIFIGHLFRAQVQCKFPMDLKASMRQVVKGTTPELVGKTSNIKNPKTNKPDLEAVFLLFEDENFSKSFLEDSNVIPEKKIFGGILIKGSYHNEEEEEEEEDVNVVVDSCWADSGDQRQMLVDRCESSSMIQGNGESSQVRMELPSEELNRLSPNYIQCAIYPCVGTNCEPTCQNGPSLNQISKDPINQVRSRKERSITNNGTDERDMYIIEIGPINYELSPEYYDPPFTDDYEDDEDPPTSTAVAVSCVAVIVFMAIAAAITVFIVVRKTSRIHSSEGSWDAMEETPKSKHRAIRVHSFTFSRPTKSVYSVYPPSYHAVARAHFKSIKVDQTI